MKEGWDYKKLGDVAFYPTKRISSEMVDENNYVGVDNLIKDRGGKVVANFFPTEGNVIEYLKGDVLLGNIRPYLKKIWLSDTKGGASGDVLIIRANDTKHLYPNYLYWVLASDQFFEYDNLHCKGAKMPRGNKIDIMQYLLPIPTIEEQQQIVSELDLLSGVIEKQKAQLEELDKLAQSIFYDMFGDPVTNEKGWEGKSLGSLCKSMVRGPFGSALKKEFFVDKADTTYKIYEQKHAIQKSAEIGDYYITKEKYEELKRFEVFPGDIIMSCSGTIGELFVIPIDAEKGVMNQALLKFTLNKNLIREEFFLYVMKFVKDSFTVHGTGLQNIGSVKIVKTLLVSLPPLSLQQEFAAKVEAIEAMKAKVRQSLKEAETLFNERIDYYFN